MSVKITVMSVRQFTHYKFEENSKKKKDEKIKSKRSLKELDE